MRHAQQLDPAPLIFKANEAITLYFARQYGLAIEQLQKVAELDPNFYVAYWGLPPRASRPSAVRTDPRKKPLACFSGSPPAGMGRLRARVERALPWSGWDREQESERGGRPRPRWIGRDRRAATRPRWIPAHRQRLRAGAR